MMVPGLAHRIIMLAGVRIDHQRQRRQAVTNASAAGVFSSAIQLIPTATTCGLSARAAITSRSGVPSLRCSGVAQREGVPGASAGILLQQGRQGLDLGE